MVYFAGKLDSLFGLNPRKANPPGRAAVGFVVVVELKRFVDVIGRVFLRNVFVVVVAASEGRAFSEGGRLGMNDGCDFGIGCSTGTFRGISDAKISSLENWLIRSQNLPNPSKLNGNLPMKHP